MWVAAYANSPKKTTASAAYLSKFKLSTGAPEIIQGATEITVVATLLRPSNQRPTLFLDLVGQI